MRKNKLVKKLLVLGLCAVCATTSIGMVTACGNTNDNPPGTESVAVESVTLNKATLSLKVGGSETLTVTVNPSNATNKAVSWSSSAPAVATVTNGKVEAKAVGTAEITATADGKSAKCTVTVTAADTVAVTGITVTAAGSATTVEVNKTLQLSAAVAPETATNKNVTWSSSDNAKATVNNSGLVTGVAAGEVKITATSVSNNTVKGEITLNVTTGTTDPVTKQDVALNMGTITPATLTDGAALCEGLSAYGAVVVEANSKGSTFKGEAFTSANRYKLDKTVTNADAPKGIKVNLTAAAKVLVYAYSGSGGQVRSLALYDSTKTIIDNTTQSIGDGTDNVLGVAMFDVAANTEYYIGAVNAGINVYFIAVCYNDLNEDKGTLVPAVEQDCTTGGKAAYYLSNYGRYFKEDGTLISYDQLKALNTNPKGHNYSLVGEITQPTATAAGSATIKCANETANETVELPKLSKAGAYARAAGSAEGKTKYTFAKTDWGTFKIEFEADTVEEAAASYTTVFEGFNNTQTVKETANLANETANGIYFSTDAADTTKNSVTINSENQLFVDDTSTSTTFGYVKFDAITNGVVKITGTIIPTANNNSWSFIQLADNSHKDAGLIAALRVGNNKLGLTTGNSNPSDGVAFVANEELKFEFTLDLTNKTIVVKIDNVTKSTTGTYNATLSGDSISLQTVKFQTAGTAERQLYVKSLKVETLDED